MSNLPDLATLWDYDQPDQSERDFKALLPLVQSDPANLNYELELLTQIARAQGLQRHFEEGHRTLDEVERRMTPRTTVEVRYLLERGRMFRSGDEKEQARPLFERAWELGQQIGETGYAVDAAHMLGILDAPDLTWNLKALDLAESSPDPRAQRWRASLYNNIGWSYHDNGDYDKALEIFAKALALREEEGNSETIRIARWAVARTLRSLNRLDEALALQRQNAAQIQREGGSDGYIEEEIGEILLAQGQSQAAKAHFARAYEQLSLDDWLVEREPARLERLSQLGS
ncbi:MAG: tetratricopeptide repeat protein [Chloroflexi bacterium]|nr:tetratricopeptide repeat protein [Chloroflexota bacterium]